MRMVQASLLRVNNGSGTAKEACVLDELLWAHATAAHCLEHVRVRPAPYGLELVMFLRSETEAGAVARAHALLAVARLPLRTLGYTVGTAPPPDAHL
ncbi:hypothetical protein [Streptomyces sp. NPDC048659]|uniref:hypothetical protein n=1 Tax=Streptomyces sp. NPDC048659 TaxID=3155489 RepID=UPI003426B0D5